MKTPAVRRDTRYTDAACRRLAEGAAFEAIFSDAHQRALRIRRHQRGAMAAAAGYWALLAVASAAAAAVVISLKGWPL